MGENVSIFFPTSLVEVAKSWTPLFEIEKGGSFPLSFKRLEHTVLGP
jgi:hypothetical protein